MGLGEGTQGGEAKGQHTEGMGQRKGEWKGQNEQDWKDGKKGEGKGQDTDGKGGRGRKTTVCNTYWQTQILPIDTPKN